MDYEDRIRERAHRIWEEEGRPDGRHREHWERACRENESASMSGASAAADPGGAPNSRRASAGIPTGHKTSSSQSTSSSGLVGADDTSDGTPGVMGVDDLNVAGRLSDPSDSRPTTGRSKLVGS